MFHYKRLVNTQKTKFATVFSPILKFKYILSILCVRNEFTARIGSRSSSIIYCSLRYILFQIPVVTGNHFMYE